MFDVEAATGPHGTSLCTDGKQAGGFVRLVATWGQQEGGRVEEVEGYPDYEN